MNPVLARLASNPFLVLELPIDATAVEVERQGQKLQAMLAVGLEAAATYPTPFGVQPRTVDAVREALAALRDPGRRSDAERWAHLPPPRPAPPRPPPFADLRERMGWR